jgi:hypothetical protein
LSTVIDRCAEAIHPHSCFDINRSDHHWHVGARILSCTLQLNLHVGQQCRQQKGHMLYNIVGISFFHISCMHMVMFCTAHAAGALTTAVSLSLLLCGVQLLL